MKTIDIQTREHLLNTLAEAAELEHNLMCLYLYAVFTLKESEAEGLSRHEMEAVGRWRRSILDVCVQEMSHLALVSNLTTAVGGTAHFFRSDFPMKPGYFPAEFVMELAPFDLDTIQHFIFLERPQDLAIEDDANSKEKEDYRRGAPRGRLMTHVGDYKTVSQLYQAVEDGIHFLKDRIGEAALFCGPASLQLGPADVQLEGLELITDGDSAVRALHAIVEQGEGGQGQEGSHFAAFCHIKDEYMTLLEANPHFQPARPCARNPVMRRPAEDDERVWVNAQPAALVLDLANALYGLMLRFLVQIYSMESRSADQKKILLNAAFTLMHALSATARYLCRLPADPKRPGVNAGMSFALNRHFTPFEVGNEKMLLSERLTEVMAGMEAIMKEPGTDSLRPVLQSLEAIRVSLQKLPAVQ
ncbi:MAG TPA: ferritin-like domain-containing protein [Oligoflexus sp.]|uniref:ferritin-like domain-containing protein n=1 Tax=Oligoflexus sp. TaxID=1971216 RepID=UPI002D505E44|nr:ferritin-like domain-containing protein [Oligoflexus sp.]HYX35507.1 ferritin-like domain-containing protein [Oligoflexus sp.]